MGWFYKGGIIAGIIVAISGLVLIVIALFTKSVPPSAMMTGGILFLAGILIYFINNYFYKIFKDFPTPKGFNASFRDSADKMSNAADFLKEQNRVNKLSMTGKPAKVKIISVKDTGQMVNFDTVLEFNLEVLQERRYDNYNIDGYKQVVSKIIAPGIVPGNEYPARIDPADKNNIYISWI
jgi:hypothetical protein